MQCGYLSLFYSTSDKPLEYWSKQKSKTGTIQRIFDKELNERVLEIQDVEESNSQKTWIMCPPTTEQILDVKLPVLVITLKSLQAQLLIQLQIVDKNNVRHLINLSNVDVKKNNKSSNNNNNNNNNNTLKLSLQLEPGWNEFELDLVKFCEKYLNVEYDASTRLKICANCRLRRLHFIDRHYDNDELSLPLYHGFFDNYMAKWGISAIERATQTKKCTGNNVNGKEIRVDSASTFNKLFLKNLQTKSDKTIDENFAKHPRVKLKDYLEFKKRAKIKPYVIPDRTKFTGIEKITDRDRLDVNEIKKYFGRDAGFLEKFAFEDTTVEEDKGKKITSATTTTKIENTEDFKFTNNQEIKNLMYKVYRYKYPGTTDKRQIDAKKESTIKYTVVKK